jgi:hypothetical protein
MISQNQCCHGLNNCYGTGYNTWIVPAFALNICSITG